MDHDLRAGKSSCRSHIETGSSHSGGLVDCAIGAAVLKFSLPILFANALQSLNASINAMWVGHYLGDAALAATSNANMVMGLLVGGTFGIPVAATIFIGYRFGAGRIKEARRVVGTGATVFSVVAVTVAALGFNFAQAILVCLGTPADSLLLSVVYLRVALVGLPFTYLYAFAIFALRGTGDSKTPFLFLLASVAIDIALNPVFIFGVGPIARLGIAGSALATVFGQAIGLTGLVAYLYSQHHPLCLRRDELAFLRVDWNLVGMLFAKGVPMSANVLMASLKELLMISLVNRVGVDTTAAYGASIQVWNYIQLPAFSIGLAMTAMVAQNIGANRWDRVQTITRVGVFYGILLTGALVLAVELLGRHVFALFLPADSPALPITAQINQTAAWSFVFMSVHTVVFGVMRAAGAVWMPLSILTVVVAVRFAITAALLGHWHAEVIWWSFPVSSAVTATLAALYCRYGKWRTATTMHENLEPA